MRTRVRLAVLAVVGVTLALVAVRFRRSPLPFHRDRVVWQPAYEGVELAAIEVQTPRPLKLYAARIDLRRPGVRLQVSPGLAPGHGRMATKDLPAEVTSSTTAEWLKAARCQVAVNASPFAPVVDDSGVPMEVEGLHLADGVLVSPHRSDRDVLVATVDNRVRIGRADTDMTGVTNGVSGFEIVAEDGKVLPNVRRNPDIAPRTAAGVTRDGNGLVLLVIDGRQDGFSEGVTLAELGEWMLRLGAWSALNFDGGGSSAMVMADEEGDPVVVNSPIHRGVAGRLRPSANHLCVFARPLPRR